MIERKFVWLVLAFIVLLSGCDGARILGIVPMPARSHHIAFLSLMRELASRQHEVTVMNFFPQEKPIPNYTDITLNMDVFKEIHAGNMFTDTPSTVLGILMKLWGMGNLIGDHLLQSPNVQEVIHSKNQHFDLVILEAFANEAFLGFAHKFKAPVIFLCPFGGTHWMHSVVGNPSTFSYIPDTFLNFNDHMTFPQRIHNTLIGVIELLVRELYYLPQQDAIMRKYFNNSGPIPDIRELERQTSLLLLNSDVSLSYPRPMVPNAVQVGGMHIKPPKKLPEDLQKYLDVAPHGVIYFSMGSNLKSSQLPDEKRKALLDVFSKMKQKVMWKWEADTLPGQPANLMIRKWFPQSDILAHPNVKLFITHGGLLSTMETVYYGVPILGISIFGDQQLNMRRAELSGYGIRIDFSNLTSESLEWGLNTILNDPSYRENAKRLSKLFRDQPETPMERAVYWVEYVIRHKGAPHLHSAALDLYWFQYFLLDVILVILGVVVLSAVLIYFSIKTVLKMLTKTSKKKKPTASNKKKKN
ncbi:UDP-glycosyltransferase UGT5 [Anabrus simplex]|uniref:UDP-glycosyltransferase UGT5 n=1 Tax=Anabrus simplex TaxID=316456 RepID=UPI0035A3877C